MTRYLIALAALAALGGCYRDAGPPVAPEPAAEEEAPPVARKKKKRAPPPAKAVCDEVSCVLDAYTGPCCDRYRKRAGRPVPVGAPPTALDRGMIASAVASARPQIQACASQAPARGTVKVTVRVAPDGMVRKLSVLSGIDPAIDSCVVAAISRIAFPATDVGGSFTYPFAF
jgi:TonB family protein